MADKRVTKKEMFETIKSLIAGDESLEAAQVREFCDTQIASLVKTSAARAAKRAENVEPDELADVVKSILTAAPQTVEQILGQINGDVSIYKVQARCTKLVKSGDAVKSEITLEDGSKKKVYALA